MPDYAELRILVVDDDPLMVDLLTRVLVGLGAAAPHSAADGGSGLEAVDASPLDLVFCDIDMPGMDGVEFLRHLGRRPDPPAIAVISSTPEVVRDTVERLGKAHHLRVLGSLRKPASPAEVAAVLDSYLAQPATRPVPSAPGYLTLPADEVVALLPRALEVHYQPIVHAVTGEVHAVEALARLRHPQHGLIGPDLFVPLCERAGASAVLLQCVLEIALRDIAGLQSRGHAALKLSVNVSADDLGSPDLVGEIADAAEKAGVPLSLLTLELTETRILSDTSLPIEILTRLRVRGANLAIDDYGTGFASLKQLKRIPFNELKIDRIFVSDSHTDARKRTMLASTIELAHQLELLTVAEGVETLEELALVTELGCDLVQGFLLSRPMPLADLTTYLDSRRA